MREVIVGFDSAWADNPKVPGAICALVFEDGRLREFHEPRNVGFSTALTFVSGIVQEEDYLLVAVDQPIIVANLTGSRPCERVAATLISRLQGGVQPGRRSGGGARFFGDDAPIWRFLDGARLETNAYAARSAVSGRYAVEVFPALSLPFIEPEFHRRGLAAKYNPAKPRKFRLDDWQMVCSAAAGLAGSLEIGALAGWLSAMKLEARPSKGDQDCLDAALCLLIGLKWRRGRSDETFIVGCGEHGYILAVGAPREVEGLQRAALERGVPFNTPW